MVVAVGALSSAGFVACSGDDSSGGAEPDASTCSGCSDASAADGTTPDGGKDAAIADSGPDAPLHAPGSLDLSFGTGGTVTVDFADAGDDLEDLTVLSDGRVIGVGVGTIGTENKIGLAALLANGTLDPTFGAAAPDSGAGAGKVTADLIPGTFSAASRVFETDAGLVVSAYRTAMVAALGFDKAGSVDDTYGTSGRFAQGLGGTQNVPGAWAARRPDGKIVIGGNFHVNASNDDAFFLQLDSHGALDPAFAADGSAPGFETVDENPFDAPLDLALQSDGKILASGFFGDTNTTATLYRLAADGTFDTSFGAGDDGGVPGVVTLTFGTTTDDEAAAVAVQSDDEIVVVHRALASSHVVRYSKDGVLDTTFGTGGVTTATVPGFTKIILSSAAIQADGKILLGGYAVETSAPALKLAVLRLNANGTVDSTFGTNGVAVAGFAAGDARGNAIRVQADGRIVIGGFVEGATEDFVFARFWP